MKVLQNNQSNKILFVNSASLVIGSVTANVVQLGSDNVIVIPVTKDSSDCFTVTFDITLTANQLQNANYMLSILNAEGVIIFSATIRAEGNTDINRSYVVID